MAWPGRFWQIVKSFASPLQSTVEGRRRFGLSAKLLLLTILFVMLAEVLIFVPSVANFRITWLTDRLTAAQLAALAAEAVPGGVVPDALRLELLRTAQVKAVALKRDNERRLVLPADGSLNFDSTYDFRASARPSGIIDQLALRFRLIGCARRVFRRRIARHSRGRRARHGCRCLRRDRHAGSAAESRHDPLWSQRAGAFGHHLDHHRGPGLLRPQWPVGAADDAADPQHAAFQRTSRGRQPHHHSLRTRR